MGQLNNNQYTDQTNNNQNAASAGNSNMQQSSNQNSQQASNSNAQPASSNNQAAQQADSSNPPRSSSSSSSSSAVTPGPSSAVSASSANDKSSTSSSGSSSGGSCPADLVNLVWNGTPWKPSQKLIDSTSGAANWLTFGLGTATKQIPMMAYASDVSAAIDLVNGANPPAYMLTFNEPDYSYHGQTATMSPQQAAQAIAPLIAKPGTGTKFIAPSVADANGGWLEQFYTACNCKDFFHAYNMHLYVPDLSKAKSDISAFHGKWPDKPLWVTEIAPGQANPACSLSWDQATTWMQGLYSWAAGQTWLERVFWNSGNQIQNDQNVCNSYLTDQQGNPSPLLDAFNSLSCS